MQLEKRWKTMEAEKKPLMDRAEVIEVRLQCHCSSLGPAFHEHGRRADKVDRHRVPLFHLRNRL